MPLSWDSVVEGTVVGVAASVAFGLVTLGYGKARNILLRRRILREIQKSNCGSGINGITAHIHNRVGREFSVREVLLVTEKEEFTFNPTGEVTSTRTESKVSIEDREKLLRGEVIEMAPQLQFRSQKPEPSEEFPVVRPFTSVAFLLPAEFLPYYSARPKHLRITVEYQSWTDETCLVQAETSGSSLEMLKTTLSHYHNEYESGSLNKARAMFGLPELPPRHN